MSHKILDNVRRLLHVSLVPRPEEAKFVRPFFPDGFFRAFLLLQKSFPPVRRVFQDLPDKQFREGEVEIVRLRFLLFGFLRLFLQCCWFDIFDVSDTVPLAHQHRPLLPLPVVHMRADTLCTQTVVSAVLQHHGFSRKGLKMHDDRRAVIGVFQADMRVVSKTVP